MGADPLGNSLAGIVTIPFTQLLLPMNFPKNVEIDLPDEDGSLAAAVDTLLERGYVFRCAWSDSSGTRVTLDVTHDEHGVIIKEECANGPVVLGAIDRMLRRAFYQIVDKDDANDAN